MFDIGWSELLIIGVIAILVVGPRDLPRMMRTVGQYVSKMRAMGRDLQRQFDAAVREAELDDVRKTVTDIGKANPMRDIREAVTKPMTTVANELKKTAGEVERREEPAKPEPAEAAGSDRNAATNATTGAGEPRDPAPEPEPVSADVSAESRPGEPQRAATGS